MFWSRSSTATPFPISQIYPEYQYILTTLIIIIITLFLLFDATHSSLFPVSRASTHLFIWTQPFQILSVSSESAPFHDLLNVSCHQSSSPYSHSPTRLPDLDETTCHKFRSGFQRYYIRQPRGAGVKYLLETLWWNKEFRKNLAGKFFSFFPTLRLCENIIFCTLCCQERVPGECMAKSLQVLSNRHVNE